MALSLGGDTLAGPCPVSGRCWEGGFFLGCGVVEENLTLKLPLLWGGGSPPWPASVMGVLQQVYGHPPTIIVSIPGWAADPQTGDCGILGCPDPAPTFCPQHLLEKSC